MKRCYRWRNPSNRKNNTWELVSLPKGEKARKSKVDIQSQKECQRRNQKIQSRVGGKGYGPQYDIDYDETFAYVANLETIRLIFHL